MRPRTYEETDGDFAKTQTESRPLHSDETAERLRVRKRTAADERAAEPEQPIHARTRDRRAPPPPPGPSPHGRLHPRPRLGRHLLVLTGWKPHDSISIGCRSVLCAKGELGMKHRRQLGKASEERDNLSPHQWGLLPPLPDPLKTDNPSLLLILIFSLGSYRNLKESDQFPPVCPYCCPGRSCWV
uniref:FXYD domain-containing ion transport regulator 4 isoform X3 n=1 Tax=Nyctereutes procyonoides TaxID=34880 RepID=UPI002444941C|nr:FXYD domain-containing ion transport regulator 4 isoform X3 [Nyctereutes procyonoides]